MTSDQTGAERISSGKFYSSKEEVRDHDFSSDQNYAGHLNSENSMSPGNWGKAKSGGIQVSNARRISRDEMNLAEFPLAVLSTRTDPNIKTLEFSDTITHKSGELIKRNWVITGADKFGLPTSSDDEVLLGLLKLSVDDGLATQKVFFTRYELLKILKWTTEGRSYLRLQNAFDRLSGVRIKATNAFYDNESKTHSTKNFGIVDAYEINDGREAETKPSFFIWSEELFKSFQVGFIKKLDLDFYLDLKSAVSKRLYRYLDKHFWYKARVANNLFTLCHEKIGVSRNYKYASSLRQQLDPAVEELIALNFLEKVEYVGKGKNAEVIFYAARGKPRSQAKDDPELQLGNRGSTGLGLGNAAPAAREISKNSASLRRFENKAQQLDPQTELFERLKLDLAQRGVAAVQTQRLLGGHSAAALERVQQIIEYFDDLVARGSHLVSKNAVGFLYRAVEQPFKFNLPADAETQKAPKSSRKNTQAEVKAKQADERDQAYREYLNIRRMEVDRLLETVERRVLLGIRAEVEQSLVRVKGLISEANYEEAIQHTMEERLAKLFALPTFEEWLAER